MATSTADLAGLAAPAHARNTVWAGAAWSKWAIGLLVWTALALLSSLQTVVSLRSMGQPIVWSYLLPRNLLDWYTCAVFTPAYFWMVRRWPMSPSGVARPIAIYAGITAVIVVLKYAMYVPLANLLISDPGRHATLGVTLTNSFITENVAFWCMLGIVVGVEYHRTLREREVQEARLQTQLAEAKLRALAAQLHPHFLFNTIQGVSTLIHRDPNAADGMLARLSTLLRHSLQQGGGHEFTLGEELELLELYLGIVRERFGDRLTLTFDIESGAQDVLVPRFLLQPLVENALHHGIARRAGEGRIEIRATRQADTLVLTVADDGPGATEASRPFPRAGIGLANTRDRLAQLHGDNQSLVTESGENGFLVTVRVPWRLPASE